MKRLIRGSWWKSSSVIFLILSVYCSFVQAVENETGNLTTTQQEILLAQKECTSLETCQQLGKLVATKSTDDSKAISNLTNAIYYLTVFVMALTFLASILTFIFQYRQEQILKDWVKVKADYLEKWVNDKVADLKTENNRLQLEMRDMKETVHKELQNEFQDELMNSLAQKIDRRVDSYGKLVAQQMFQHSDQHEERLYYVEQVRSELLKQSQPKDATPDSLSEWILEQQEDYFALLKLISPYETDTFEALDVFRSREKLPDSFLELLRFLDKQNRLPGESRIKADEIAQEKFGKSLDKED